MRAPVLGVIVARRLARSLWVGKSESALKHAGGPGCAIPARRVGQAEFSPLTGLLGEHGEGMLDGVLGNVVLWPPDRRDQANPVGGEPAAPVRLERLAEFVVVRRHSFECRGSWVGQADKWL